MKISDVKKVLTQMDQIAFQLPEGELVPSHFHVTEIGKVDKHFIDCGGKLRKEEVVNFQLWNENDYNHRLHPEKLLHIIDISERELGIGDHEIEVEYQGNTIGKYGLDFDGVNFLLTATHTTCLAREECSVPVGRPGINFKHNSNKSCVPGTNCC